MNDLPFDRKLLHLYSFELIQTKCRGYQFKGKKIKQTNTLSILNH